MCSVRVLGSSLSDTSLSHQTGLGLCSQIGFLEAIGVRVTRTQKPLGGKKILVCMPVSFKSLGRTTASECARFWCFNYKSKMEEEDSPENLEPPESMLT